MTCARCATAVNVPGQMYATVVVPSASGAVIAPLCESCLKAWKRLVNERLSAAIVEFLAGRAPEGNNTETSSMEARS